MEIGHFVNLLEHQINATPIGVRTKGKRGNTDNRSFLAEVVTPAELAGELGRSPALGKITLPIQVEDYLLQKSEVRQALDEFMEAHIINSRRRTSKNHKCNTNIEEGSVVAFQVTTDTFHPTYSKWRFGRIVKFSPVGVGGEPRSAEIMYLSFP